MVFPTQFDDELDDELEEDLEADDPREIFEEDSEDRADWLDEVEDAYIAQGDVTVSETVDGHDPTPDLDDEDAFENAFDEAMHEEDLD